MLMQSPEVILWLISAAIFASVAGTVYIMGGDVLANVRWCASVLLAAGRRG